MNIPYDLKQALETGNGVLFVGAGMGYNMIDSEGNHIPDGPKLAEAIARRFALPINGNYDLAKTAEYVVIQKKGRTELDVYIKGILETAYPDDSMKWIPTIKWKAIFTTNYDDCIQKAYDESTNPVQNYVTITHLSGFRDCIDKLQVPIIHLHGSLFDIDSNEIIITQSDYVNYTRRRKSLFEYLKSFMATSCILFTGYSHNDPNFQSIINDVMEEISPHTLPQSYRIDPFTDDLSKCILENQKILTLPCTFSDFVKDARLQLELSIESRISYEHMSQSIPSTFRSVFDHDPVSVIRLFSSWDYVNELERLPAPNVHDYVRGNKPNWEIIFNDKYFHRNVEDEITYTLMDYATDARKRVQVCTITGSAGYGISTLLMSLAKKVVNEKIGKAFFHKTPKDLREGDVFFAYSLCGDEKCFVFIDNAADHAEVIKSLIRHAREQKKDIVFVLGDRINELLTSPLRLSDDTFEIEPLCDSEIEKLLDYLAENDELNNLKYLERTDQIAAIKVNYSRELLVAIREATESKNFEAIISDEYINISCDFSKKVYSILACFHQHSAYLRMELLARLFSVDIVEIYQKVGDSLKGIIYYEAMDEAKGIYVARTRHRIIASIVWNKCLVNAEKDEIIHNILDNMNIAYSTDLDAFESFVKSDQLVDSLVSLESRMRFYEKACKIDPNNPYVKQHYARMLIRSRQEQAALNMINDAIKMDNRIRMLHHTKGHILQQIALYAESEEIARRWIGQSEEAYRIALRLNEKDSYAYQGLSSLYLEWSKKCKDESERTLYLSKAEEIIAQGMEKVNNKEDMWIASSEIDYIIGNLPNQINALERAVEIAPLSVLSRHLLAKAYIQDKRYEDAKELLQAIIQEHPDEYRISINYAKVILLTQGQLTTAIAVLQQSTLFGYSDAKFVSMLGGLLFLAKRFSESRDVFEESLKRQMYNQHRIMFFPDSCGIDNEVIAEVKYVGNGYSILNLDGFPEIKCRTTKYEGTTLRNGLKVRIKIEFTPSSPIAQIISNMG